MGDRDLIISQIRQRLEILYQMVEELEREPGPTPPGPGGTTDYNDLTNKPQIEGTTLSGNKTAAQLGLATSSSVSSITSRFEDLITPDNIEVEDDGQLPSTIDSRLALHQPIMLNHAIYYCYDESGVDYTYVALDTSGAYPKLSYAQIFKDNKRVHFYNYATDTVPASNSDNFITSGGVYSAIQGLATVARTGSYTDLLNTPTIPDVSNYYTKTETDSEISDAIGDLALVARTGDYDDLENKPTIPAAQVNADWNAVSGVAQILNKPTIPAAQVNSDWNASSGVARILNKPTLGTAAAANTTTSITSGGAGLPTSGTVYTSQAAQDAEIGAVEERGAKNLLKIENYNVGETYTYRGRKFTVLADGGVKIETVGTVSSAVDFYLIGSWTSTAFEIPEGQYKASLISTSSTAAGVQICVYDRSTGSTVSQLRVGLNNQRGTDFNFGVTTVFISISQDVSIGENGVIVYPMIRPAAMKNPDFAQYAPTNLELYETKISLEDILGVGTTITSNSSMDNLTAIGKWYCVNAGTAVTVANAPFTDAAYFGWTIRSIASSDRYIQIAIKNSDDFVVAKRRYSGVWSAWSYLTGTAGT